MNKALNVPGRVVAKRYPVRRGGEPIIPERSTKWMHI